MVNLKYIVTGTGRCGTLFMANLLTSMGYPCTHEAVFTTNGLQWAEEILEGYRPAINSKISMGDNLSDYEMDSVADSSYLAAPFLQNFKNVSVIHVVRNPFEVIGSLIGDGFKQFTSTLPTDFQDDPDHFPHEAFIYDYLPELSGEVSQLDRACAFYLRWNEMIERNENVKIFHRIEDGTEKIKEFFGYSGPCYENKKCNSVSKKKKWKISEIKNPILRNQITEIFERYGYQSEIRKRMIL